MSMGTILIFTILVVVLIVAIVLMINNSKKKKYVQLHVPSYYDELNVEEKPKGLIKCEDCGHEISRRASVCPHCGCPVENVAGAVKIKIPRTEKISGGVVGLMSSKDVYIKGNGLILWSGKHGETASFNIAEPVYITIDLGTWGNVEGAIVKPRHKYELVQDYGFHMVATFRLSEVDIIDSRD